MNMQSQNTMVEVSSENNSCVDVLLLSKQINPQHPLWSAIKRAGHNVIQLSEGDLPEVNENNSLLLIDDTSKIISTEWVNLIIRNYDKLKAIPRVLLKLGQDDNADFKSRIYQTDAWIEISSNDESTLDKIAAEITRLSGVVHPPSDNAHDWRKSANLLMENLFNEYSRIDLISDVAALGPIIKEYEYTIKSLLKQITKSFEIPVASIYILADNTTYTNVCKPITDDHLEKHLLSFKEMFKDDITDRNYTDIVWGRRLVKTELDATINTDYAIGNLLLETRNQIIGYISVPLREDNQSATSNMNLMSMQIGLLVNCALLHKIQQLTVQNNILKLGAISETCRLFTNADRKNFGLQFLLILLEHLVANKGIFALMENDVQLSEVHAVGFDEKTQSWLSSEEALPWRDIFNSKDPISDSVEIPSGQDDQTEEMHYIGYPLTDVQGRIGAIFIFFKHPPVELESFMPFFITMTTLASTHFANIKLYEEFLEKRIMEEQINILRDIQQGLLPQVIPSSNRFQVAAKSRSAKQVGGDFYDFIELPDNQLVVVIGDVSGKGVPASLLMSMTKSLMKFRLQQEPNLRKTVIEVNRFLAMETPSEKFITSQAILINEKNKSIEFINAGHGLLMVYRAQSGTFSQIDAEGLPLGILPDCDFEAVKTEYSTGDILLMFTDGLSEAMSPTREQFGIDRIKDIVARLSDASADDILAELYRSIKEHASGKPQHDDTTVIVLKAT